ncbi:MAG: bifunctional demethylmenaquinone methyltransferase/2-methoxy-6-polyprenyl-1,4-benzoquinol methylase UbiE [Planctomycetaceae bacterium]|jgi:demethylmenaquinone methyltransferase/2-methoxy-6-polyprenyl-1,4-benzoquinol methylase|nr:bifunctional demethylmenaquinone methyltransferase/2-methoxy-6-polyprenyl-1,4-benzoquinol methylase UbiE [Planctomycetaceae bacterium]
MQDQNKHNLDKSPERIKRMFDSIASWYDFLNHFFSLGLDCVWRRRVAGLVISALGSGGVGSMLDVCCGTGDLIREFMRQNNSDGEFNGIDFSEAMIEIARKKLPAISNRLIVGDATELPFDDGTFNVVSCAFGLRNICEMERGLSEMIRVCKQNGMVAILEFAMPKNYLIKYPYQLYFKCILPRIGEIFARNHDGAYNYLPQSVIEFDNPIKISNKMQQLGITEIKIVPMTFGIANLIYGKKIF